MSDLNVPIIKVEVESARRQIMHMLQQSGNELHKATESAVKAELDRMFDGDTLQRHVQQRAKHYVEAAVNEAIEEYFKYGAGGKSVKDAATKILDDMFKVDGVA